MNSDQVLYLNTYLMKIVEAHMVNIIFLSDSLFALELFTLPTFLSTLKFMLFLVVRFPLN